MKESTKKLLKPILGLVILGIVIVVIICGYLKVSTPDPVILQGQMEAKEVNVASKISGRIDEIYVQEGDKITEGMPILHFDSPEITAKVAQAEAVKDAASAIAKKAETGARTQEKQMAFEQMQRAKAGFDVAKKTWKRIRTLAKEGLLSQQKADEVKAKYISAEKLYDIAKAQYEMAQEGARKEDIVAAKAKARQGQAVFDEAMVAEDAIKLKSPVSGEVAEVIPSAGEIVAKGVPVITVVNLSKDWIISLGFSLESIKR